MHERRRIELVYAPLNRPRRDHDQHTTILDPVQRIHAVDDLLERATWNNPGEDRVGLEDGDGLAGQTSRQPPDQLFVRKYHARVAMLSQSPAQLVGVPASTGAQNRDVHSIDSIAQPVRRGQAGLKTRLTGWAI